MPANFAGVQPRLAPARLRFTARDANGPAVVVSTVGCGTDGITVSGKPQPGLWDTHARLAAMARQLLGSAAI